MTSALTLKELRESAGLALLGLAGLVVLALTTMGFSPLSPMFGWQRPGTIPFLYDSFVEYLAFGAGALAIALGFKQSLGDFWGDAQLFVLHRPISRRHVYLTKLLVGLALTVVLAAMTVALYALWAATPGTHASPFAWSMTGAAWMVCLAVSVVYLGAFLSGIRPAAWLGTRLMPLAAAAMAAAFVISSPIYVGLPVALVSDLVLIGLILHVVETRDFS